MFFLYWKLSIKIDDWEVSKVYPFITFSESSKKLKSSIFYIYVKKLKLKYCVNIKYVKMVYINIDQNNPLNIQTETDLQKAVVKYLRDSDLLFTSNGLPEFLDSVEKRISATQRGYLVGCPDIIILTPCSGYNFLAIELKSPKFPGKISKEQNAVLAQIEKESNAFCLISNDYPEIIEIIMRYTNGLLM